MRKSGIYIGILSLLLTGGVFAQSTTSSTNPNESTRDTTKQRTTIGASKSTQGTRHQANSKGNSATQQGKATNADADIKNVGNQVSNGGVVGKGSSAGSQAASKTGQSSPATSPAKKTKKETINISQGPINKTQPGTEVKKGSGSSPKNMKNKTGKTGNYQNQETKNTNGNQ